MEKRKTIWYITVFVFVILSFISLKCKKDDHQNGNKYDLFPLKVGNEFYYEYKYSFDDFIVGHDTIGTEKWTVLTDSLKNKNIEYYIEKKLNGIYIDWSDLYTDRYRDTSIITDKIDHFKIVESPSGELQFWEISIPRYCDKPDSVIRISPSMDYSKTYYFTADSGLTQYYKSWGLMSNRIRESYVLAGAKILN